MRHRVRAVAAVAALCGQLGYPATTDAIRARFDSITARGAGIVFVAENGGSLVGWIHASVSPVLEADLYGEIAGLVVDASCRSHGVGRTLVKAAEDWARGHGCLEMASDALIDNQISQQAHEALGYEVVDRCVHYRKSL